MLDKPGESQKKKKNEVGDEVPVAAYYDVVMSIIASSTLAHIQLFMAKGELQCVLKEPIPEFSKFQ